MPEALPPTWLTRDPDEALSVVVDIRAAAADGCALLRLHYDEETNNIHLQISREDGSE